MMGDDFSGTFYLVFDYLKYSHNSSRSPLVFVSSVLSYVC